MTSEKKTELMIYRSQLEDEIATLDSMLARYSAQESVQHSFIFVSYGQSLEQAKKDARSLLNEIIIQLSGMK